MNIKWFLKKATYFVGMGTIFLTVSHCGANQETDALDQPAAGSAQFVRAEQGTDDGPTENQRIGKTKAFSS
jgi:hypothetical protein